MSEAGQTYVTRHVTRGRLKRLRLMLGDGLDEALACACGDKNAEARYLEALCIAWFGPIFRYPGSPPRSDRGGSHARPERA